MVSIHYDAIDSCEGLMFTKNKVYTEKEYTQLIRKRELIKNNIRITTFTIIYAAMAILRAYAFFEYGV